MSKDNGAKGKTASPSDKAYWLRIKARGMSARKALNIKKEAAKRAQPKTVDEMRRQVALMKNWCIKKEVVRIPTQAPLRLFSIEARASFKG